MRLVNVGQHANGMADKRDGGLVNALVTPIDNAISNHPLNTPGLVIGSSSKKKVKIANNLLCLIGGKLVTVAAQEVAFTATSDDIADGYINVFVVNIDSAGTAYLTKGQAVLTASGVAGVGLPVLPANRCVIGVVSISTAAAIFDATTTDLDAGTVTVAYYDCTGPWGLK